jgi:dipeptidyl aminopeptidase/acylaminoacyl peptidase
MVIELKTKALSCVQKAEPIDALKHKYADRKQMVSIEWRDSDKQIVAEFAAPNSPNQKSATVFTQNGGAWATKSSEVSAKADQLEVSVQEGIDQPPTLMARIGEGTPRRVFDPNPQLKEIALGTAEFYKWPDPDGDEYSGALVKPPDFSPNRRYPLVIQTHELDKSKFLIDGPSATGFATRAFAARDIVVLQVDEINKGMGTPKESEAGAKAYEAAIKQLAAQRIVDPARVGIIGWSHMGPYVLQGLVDDPHTYAAATLAESSYDSYGEYLMNIDYMGKEREQMFRAQFGAQPFGAGLKKWMELSAGFQTDRIRTPVLFQFNSPAALVYGWDMYAALRAQDKPVEMLYIRNGDHVLVKPLERLAEQGMNIDWYDFWLNGHEDSDPAKAKQYERWREYRKHQAENDSKAGSVAAK